MKYKNYKKLFLLILCIFTSIVYAQNEPQTAPASAAKNSSSEQALEQLRMLQQRLAPQTAGAQNPTQAATSVTTTVSKTGQPATTVSVSQIPQPPQAPPIDIPLNSDRDSLDANAFDAATTQLFPMTTDQIIRLKQIYQTIQRAQESPVGTPPKPIATSQIVNLSPGSTPPVIRLSQGFVSSLVFLDSTGAPWPINAYDLGDPAAFNIQWDKISNTLMIQASKLYVYGNLAVRLRGLNTPVMLTLIPGQKAVDYRVDLRIQGYGPNAKNLPVEIGLPSAANDILLHILDGVPPAGSTRLTVSGGDARAWLSNNKMYVRTNLTILSPGWISIMTSADGTHAYEMQKSPVLLVSWHGKVMQLKVEGL